MGPGDLNEALAGLDIPYNPRVIAGVGGSEDAGVYKLDDHTALVQTVDFFTPIVDDPFTFGKAAAANSLSDVYAMGGVPITALNIVCWPSRKSPPELLAQVLAGGLAVMKEAGVALLGGHSVEDDEPKYGLSVTGIVHPDKVMTNSGLEPGDRLVLTKPLGTGLISTAGKASMALPEHTAAMIASMCSLNRAASEVATQFGLKACTDITGFGLAGHLVEMARAGKRALRVYTAAIPVLPGALEAAQNGLVPGGTYANRKFFGKWAKVDSATPLYFSDLVFDPQTSGGLVLGVPAEKTDQFIAALHAAGVTIAAVIGEVTGSDSEGVVDIV